MAEFVYKGAKTREISFPLGGIGTGCIGLAGNGRLVDWEIFNKPSKGSTNGFSHFAVKAERDGWVVDTRVLSGNLHPPYTGASRAGYGGYGFGPDRSTMAGVPHFGDVEFRGEYPIANMSFEHERFPGKVVLSAMNPLIPTNEADSSIPAAFFEISIENTSGEALDYTVYLSVNNPLPQGYALNEYSCVEGGNGGCSYDRRSGGKSCDGGGGGYSRGCSDDSDGSEGDLSSEGGGGYSEGDRSRPTVLHFVKLSSTRYEADAPQFGDLTIATDSEDVSFQEYWYRGAWFDNLGIYWRDINKAGRLTNRTYLRPPVPAAPEVPEEPVKPGTDVATLAAHVSLAAGESKTVRFILSWSFPNAINYWNPEKPEVCGCDNGCGDGDDNGGDDSGCGCGDDCDCGREATAGAKPAAAAKRKTWRNYYATVYPDSTASAIYGLEHWDRLLAETRLFKEALFSSTVPSQVMDAVSANIATLKTPTCLRLENGAFYGFEGCHCDSGCCEGSCTHVWNYAYALPFLYPRLERSMRELDYTYNQRADGSMCFRLQLPLGRGGGWFMPCADGQFGGVIKTYRDWKICGDTDWLRSVWPMVKKSVEFAWAESNECKWDAARQGVLSGRQHHTLDMELFGPNSWLTGFYLAALKAASQMAAHLGEMETAEDWMHLFHEGKAWVDEHLFNGRYYHQLVDLTDKPMLESYGCTNAYWNDEAGQMKYQIAEGCGIDMVVAQWHANICGLGEIFDSEKVNSSLKAIYENNFKNPIGDYFNACRLYSLNDEAGLVICDWPEGTEKPIVPLPYAEETMNGFEYQAAIHMIQEGMVEEGLAVVSAVRHRYDGERRNPWNEFECGSNYARSMASYALLTTLSGFEFDMVKGLVGFNPNFAAMTSIAPGAFGLAQTMVRYFWCLGSGWGSFSYTPGHSLELSVLYGELSLSRLKLPFLMADYEELASVSMDGVRIDGEWHQSEGALHLGCTAEGGLTISAGRSLLVEL